jgi:hypothetical protein
MNFLKNLALIFFALWVLKYIYSFAVVLWLARYYNPEAEG